MRQILTIIVVLICLYAEAGDNKWTTRGPFGGIIGRFTFHPKDSEVIFASGSGSLYRSRNAGNSWQLLDISGGASFPNAMVIRIHPRNPEMIYAAGTSIFTSTDRGDTWQEISRLSLARDGFNDVEFDLKNPQILYGATYRNGVFKSTDGGRTWTQKNKGLRITPVITCCDIPQIEVDPRNGNILYALLPSRMLFKSQNGGQSWKRSDKGLRFPSMQNQLNALAIDPNNPQTLYAAGFPGIFKTTDSGRTWKDTKCDCGVWDIEVDPQNPETIYGISDRIFISRDAARSWAALSIEGVASPGLVGVATHPRIKNFILAGGFGGGIFRSKDGGKNFKPMNAGVTSAHVGEITAFPGIPNRFLAESSPIVFSSTNNTRSWRPFEGLGSFFVRQIKVHPKNPQIIAAGGGPSAVAISTDGGKTFAARSPFEDTPIDCNHCLQFHPQDPGVIYLAPIDNGSSGGSDDDIHLGIAKTTNLGETWKLVNSGLGDKNVTVIAVDPNKAAILYAGTESGRIFKSINGATGWKNSSQGLQGGSITAIAIDPSDSDIIYGATQQSNQPGDEARIFKSTNGGRRWELKNNGLGFANRFSFISVDPRNRNSVYVVSPEIGLFFSIDGGENWTAFDSKGLGPFGAFHVLVHPTLPDTLLIGTPRGVFSYSLVAPPNSPKIHQVSPLLGRVGDLITIHGEEFGPNQGNSSISFNGTGAGSSDSWSESRIQVRVPSGARTGPLSVVADSNRSNPHEFIVLPSSGNVEPSSGPSQGGTRVAMIADSNLAGTQFNVLFGSSVAKDVQFLAPNIVVCTAPPGNGTVDVSVTTSAVSIHVGTFTYQ